MAGNHDYIKADSFYRDFQWEKNVTFFKNEQLTCVKDEKLDIYVYGLSYEHQEIENLLYDSIHPAEGEGVHYFTGSWWRCEAYPHEYQINCCVRI